LDQLSNLLLGIGLDIGIETLFGGIASSRFGKIEAKRGWEFLGARGRITESGEILDPSREGK